MSSKFFANIHDLILVNRSLLEGYHDIRSYTTFLINKSLFQRQYEYYNLILHTSIHCTMFTDLIYTTLNKLNYI